MAESLHDPAEHRPLTGPAWSESAARAAIAAITDDAAGAYRGPEQLWPNHPSDLEGAPDVPYRNPYFGAAGVAWALHRLAAEGLAPEFAGGAELAATLPGGYRAAPELTTLDTGTPPPPPSLLFGETGVLLCCEAIAPDAARRDALAAAIERNVENPTREMCWGSPGTMLAAWALWEAAREPRFRELWARSAQWLVQEWRELVWVQDMYGSQARYVGAGHGFAGNAMALLAGSAGHETVATGRFDAQRVAGTMRELAIVEGDLAQWPGLADRVIPRKPVQWCHGSPGIVSSLRALPADPETDALLIAGGELTWQAGPLRKGVGLCHGTAGNAYALLALCERTGDEQWLARARAFAMDAAADVGRRRAADGCGRYALFTGDLAVAMLLRSCLSADARFPLLEDALSAG